MIKKIGGHSKSREEEERKREKNKSERELTGMVLSYACEETLIKLGITTLGARV